MGGSLIAYLARQEPVLGPVMTLSGDSAPPELGAAPSPAADRGPMRGRLRRRPAATALR